jgi:hypothetical protein
MSESGQLIVTTQGDLSHQGILPVRVRTAEGRLVSSGVTGEALKLPPGAYEVSVVKPDLVEFANATMVEIVSEQSASIALGTTAPAEPESLSAYTQVESSAPGLAMASAEQTQIEIKCLDAQIWRGRWMASWPSIEAAFAEGLQKETVRLSERDALVLASDHEDDRFLLTPYERDDKTILRFSIVPHDECVACVGDERDEAKIAVTLRPGFIQPTLQYRSLRSEEANALLDFVDSGALNDMQSVTAPMIERGVAAMLDAQFSLLRGTLGAYVMLRANNVEKLEPWLAEMGEKAPGLSDIRIMRAELLGRLGRHAEAVDEIKIALVSLCPWFRSGIAYLLDRLRLYLDIEDEDKATLPMTEVDWEVFAFAKSRLEKLSPFLVTRNLFTTFDIPK